ncbi:MAG: exodeoxyribonuclease VII large subunit [bacterium]
MTDKAYIFTVIELTKYIKNRLERDMTLQGLLVRGEVSNCTYHSSGHLYFTLKDSASEVKCVMWRDAVARMKVRIDNGMKVVVTGQISVFEKSGQYQLYAYNIDQEGLGNLFLAFVQLKEKLEAEGLFDEEIKRQLPLIPKKIALITSPTGAVAHDFCTVSIRRWIGRNIVIIPTAVQGASAPISIVKSLKLAQQIDDVDVIVLARGGGSFEDLACFNDESVARAIRDSVIPVVSAIGHETDFTIADFVSDLRAPTPSAAAELVIPDMAGMHNYMRSVQNRLHDKVSSFLKREQSRLYLLSAYPAIKNPLVVIYQSNQHLDLMAERIVLYWKQKLEMQNARINSLAGNVNALSPDNVLKRGYALVENISGEVVISKQMALNEDKLNIRFIDGNLTVIPEK